MKSQEIIITALEKLVLENPELQFTYEFDECDSTHCVEVLPTSFNNDDVYLEFKMDLTLRLIAAFPYEGLFFSDDESMYKIKNPTQIILGKAFIEESKYKDLASIGNFLKEVKPFLGLNTFGDISPSSACEMILDKSITYLQEVNNIPQKLNLELGETNYAFAA